MWGALRGDGGGCVEGVVRWGVGGGWEWGRGFSPEVAGV